MKLVFILFQAYKRFDLHMNKYAYLSYQQKKFWNEGKSISETAVGQRSVIIYYENSSEYLDFKMNCQKLKKKTMKS